MKKRRLNFFIVFFITFSLMLTPLKLAETVSSIGFETGVVVIDAGHGGIDGGVTGKRTGVKESELNLDVCKKISDCLEEKVISSVLTRKNQEGLYGLPTKGFKKRDMNKRKNIIDNSNAKIVISVHMNSCPYPERSGAQVFYKKGDEKSLKLAKKLQEKLNSLPECNKKSSVLTGDYFMLNCTDKVAVLVECGFLSNSHDENLLIKEEYRKKLAVIIADTIFSYLFENAMI